MIRKEAGKGDEVKPLLKEQKKGNGLESKNVSRDDVGKEKHVRISSDVTTGQEKPKAVKEERKDNLFMAPSQSTQSLSSEDRELYPPDQIKLLRLDDIMDETYSQSISKAPYERLNGKRGTFKREREPEKVVLDQQLFDKHYGFRRVDLTLGRKVHWHFKQVLKWGRVDWAHFLMGRVPITKWLPNYNWREDLRADVLGGMMLSIMCLPQSLAYGYLVGVPPIYGLITATFGPFVYTIFGSSRHNSPGSFAIAALMVGGVVERFAPSHSIQAVPNNTRTALVHQHQTTICCKSATSTVTSDEAVIVTTCLTFLVGLWQIFFGLLNAGLLAVWLSDQLVQGLTSGAAIHVFTSQLKSLTGIDGLPPTSETFGLIRFYICFYQRINTIKVSSATVSVIGISLLIFSSSFVDPILAKWTNFKFPMEFLLVVSSILLVFSSEGTRYQINVPVVGKVDSGFPSPMLPSFDRSGDLIWQGITIAIISFVIHIALAK